MRPRSSNVIGPRLPSPAARASPRGGTGSSPPRRRRNRRSARPAQAVAPCRSRYDGARGPSPAERRAAAIGGRASTCHRARSARSVRAASSAVVNPGGAGVTHSFDGIRVVQDTGCRFPILNAPVGYFARARRRRAHGDPLHELGREPGAWQLEAGDHRLRRHLELRSGGCPASGCGWRTPSSPRPYSAARWTRRATRTPGRFSKPSSAAGSTGRRSAARRVGDVG